MKRERSKPDAPALTPEQREEKERTFAERWGELVQLIHSHDPIHTNVYGPLETLRALLAENEAVRALRKQLAVPQPLTRESALWFALQILKKYYYSKDAVEAVKLIENGLEFQRRVTVDLKAGTISISFADDEDC